jgi:hypothetical protein
VNDGRDGRESMTLERSAKFAVLEEATRRLCHYCRGGAAYFETRPELAGEEWVHRTKVDNPLWTGVSCCAGPVWTMMEELR